MSYSASVILYLTVAAGTYLPNRWPAIDFRVYSLQRESVFDQPLASNGLPLWLHYSGFQASCHNIMEFIVFILRRSSSNELKI
jgi:hypothetical protein